MEASPITQWLDAIDRRDVGLSVLAPDVRMLAADGRRAEGHDGVAELLGAFLGRLRLVEHRVTAQWHVDDVWIAEVEATYETTDYFRTAPLPRAIIARTSAAGIDDLRIYGAHEHPVGEHRTGEEGMWVGGRWVPPL